MSFRGPVLSLRRAAERRVYGWNGMGWDGMGGVSKVSFKFLHIQTCQQLRCTLTKYMFKVCQELFYRAWNFGVKLGVGEHYNYNIQVTFQIFCSELVIFFAVQNWKKKKFQICHLLFLFLLNSSIFDSPQYSHPANPPNPPQTHSPPTSAGLYTLEYHTK